MQPDMFVTILDEMKALHEKKGRDYGTDTDPLANVRACEKFGVPAWLGAVIRANDKMSRLQTYAVKGNLTNENAEDSLLDAAVYFIIALQLHREIMAKKSPAVASLEDLKAKNPEAFRPYSPFDQATKGIIA